jgi:hypothetical protein
LVPTFSVYEDQTDLSRARSLPWLERFTWPSVMARWTPDPEVHGSFYFEWTSADEAAWSRLFIRWLPWVNAFKNRGGHVAVGSDSPQPSRGTRATPQAWRMVDLFVPWESQARHPGGGARVEQWSGRGKGLHPGHFEPPARRSVEMSWEGWRSLHPDGRVVSGEIGYSRRYGIYPYGDYNALENTQTLFPVQLDHRRPPKERVLGIPVAPEAGMAYPFGILAKEHRQALHRRIDDDLLVIFWDRDLEAAVACFSMSGGQELTS